MVAEERPSPSEWWCHFHWCCVLIRFRQSSKNLLHLWDQIFFFFWQTELPPSWNFWACALGIRRHEKHRPIRAQLTSHPPPPLTTFILPPGPPGAHSEATRKALCTRFSLLLWRQTVTTFYLQAPRELSFGSRILILHQFETMNPAFLMKRNGILISVIYIPIIELPDMETDASSTTAQALAEGMWVSSWSIRDPSVWLSNFFLSPQSLHANCNTMCFCSE